MGRLRVWGPPALWAAVLLAASSRPTVPVPLESGLDKIAHFLGYAVLGALLARGMRGRGSPAALVLLGLGFAAFDEYFQGFVPGRVPDPLDWVADAAGVLAGAALYRRWTAAADRPRHRSAAAEPDPSRS